MTVVIVGKLMGRGVVALTQVVLARTLGPALFGLYALGWTVFQLAGALAPLGLNKAVMRFGSVYWPEDLSGFKSILTQSLLLGSLSGLVAGLAVYLAAPLIESVLSQPGLAEVLRWLAIGIPFLSAMSILVAASQVSRRMQYGVYAEEIGRTITGLGLILLFQFLGYGLYGATAATSASFVAGFLVSAYFILRLYPELRTVDAESKTSISPLLRFSMPTMVSDVLLMMAVWINPILIGFYLPSSQVGVYQALSQIPIAFSIILRAVNTIFSPFIASLYHAHEIERLQSLFRVTTKWTISLCLPIFIICCFTAESLITVVFGEVYAVESNVLIVLVISQMINVATGSVGFILIMSGFQREWFAFSAVAFVINLLLCTWLIPLIGVMGAAIATLFTISFLNLAGLFRIRQKIGISPYDRRHLKALAAGALAALALLPLTYLEIQSAWLDLLTVSAVTIIIYVAAMWRLGLDPEDHEFIASLTKRLTSKAKSEGK